MRTLLKAVCLTSHTTLTQQNHITINKFNLNFSVNYPLARLKSPLAGHAKNILFVSRFECVYDVCCSLKQASDDDSVFNCNTTEISKRASKY